ncbi:FAD-dependent oxidoreductase [Nitrospirillum pindoramense]|uniref:2-polyprenyl-6-methoxyphenol hydroxylase-like FAD-dependent oxidoreductase n=1 Tax=Nitrospirillum amazonense TaxID=28077 RepID=A0A560H2R8_9PROT|nr:NAD(P)/FAD-dependent oxidoreductase [Nitrospirillum amazonense]TWB40602.1 2-polyprenyl-6-methoxyphenol hydroxylase-like FAD-dependent oxidoreductase [Nitrospirillum amazonense]
MGTSIKGTIAIVGAGPGGMAAALAAIRLGFNVALFERATEIKAAGNILNLWPPPQKILKLIGVDTEDLGAPCRTFFERHDGKVRAEVILPPEVEREYGGGFIGLLRWGLYKRMVDALPPGVLRLDHTLTGVRDGAGKVHLTFANGQNFEADVLVGADGINSFVRKWLWGDAPIRHQRLHLVGGYLFLDTPPEGRGVIAHNRTTQVSYTPIRHEGKWGYEWWVLEACDPSQPPPGDLLAYSRDRARGFTQRVRDLIDATPVAHLQRWEIRDRPPLKQWSKGRATLVGDAAHPTSPYAAYGAGMSIEDGYFLARELDAVSLSDTEAVRQALQRYEDRRKPHTAQVSQGAYHTGRAFHHMPKALRPVRDWVFDHTPVLQKFVGDAMPGHILSQLAEIEDAPPFETAANRHRVPVRAAP